MRLLFGSFFTLILAAAIGLGATWVTTTRGVAFGSLRVGAWTAWPKNGSVDIDPYARATIARTGELPIGTGDGVAFYARVSGMTPAARYWTLTLYNLDGGLVPNAIDRHGFTSEEIVRQINGQFVINVAPRARPGNWLPTGGIERYVLVSRLYDTPIGVATRTTKEGPMPAVTRTGCS
jgi:hypothetical protein